MTTEYLWTDFWVNSSNGSSLSLSRFSVKLSDGFYAEYSGNFTIDSVSQIFSGTITGFTVKNIDTSQTYYTGSGFSLNINSSTVESLDISSVIATSLSGNDVISGGSGSDYLMGFAGNDSLATNAGDDTLVGGNGRDTLDGGTGIDTALYADKITSVVVALNGATSVNVSVGGSVEDSMKNIENVTGGSAADTLSGDALANILIGNAGNDVLNGLGGNDVLIGGAGKDTLDGGFGIDTADYSDKTTSVVVTLNGATNATVTIGGVAEDTIRNIENITGGSAADTLTGDGLTNIIKGGAGNDILDGGAGIDTLDYSGSSTSVIAVLNGTVFSSVTLTGIEDDTVRNFENLVGGTASDTLIGDSFANVLTGNSGNDLLIGSLGNDTLSGCAGNDTLEGGTGSDTADYADKTTAVIVTLNGSTNATVKVGGVAEDTVRNIENVTSGSVADTLTGDSLANTLIGNAGNDVLNGMSGNDFLRGGVGKDTLDGGIGTDTADYSDKTSAVAVVLNSSTSANVSVGGVAEDTIKNIENVTGGSAADSLTGDSLANSLIGNAGNDALNGMSGNDFLRGGLGNDTLTGGAGQDTFRFDTILNGLTNVDRITDFVVADDTIQLENSIFTKFGLSTTGAINSAYFKANITGLAADNNDYIIYETDTGKLFYDADGNGVGASVQIALLGTNLTLTSSDFVLV